MTKIYPPIISTTEWTESTYASIKKGRHVFAVCKPKDGIIHESEWVELGKWLGDFSGELVGVQIQADQILQFTQFLWDLTIEIVPVQLPANNRSPLSQSRSTPHLNYRKKNSRIDMGAYRYLRFTRRPSSGPREPEILEFPKSLKHLPEEESDNTIIGMNVTKRNYWTRKT